MKKIGYAVLSAAALLGVSSAQAAENLPWTYVEAAYNSLDGDEDDEPRALALAGSIGFLSKWHAQLEYLDGDVESDFEGQDPEFDGFRITVGAHPQITDKTQLLANIAYFDYEGDLDFDGGEGGEFDFGSDGLALGFGLRHAVSDKLELTGQVWYLDGDEFFGDAVVFVDEPAKTRADGVTIGSAGGLAAALKQVFQVFLSFGIRWQQHTGIHDDFVDTIGML